MSTPVLDALWDMARAQQERTGKRPALALVHPSQLADLHADIRIALGDRPDLGSLAQLREQVEAGKIEIMGMTLGLHPCAPVIPVEED